MVDENTFRQVLRSTDHQPCTFGKAILAGCCACSLAARLAIAERETVNCTQAAAREQCLELYDLLHRNSLFALKLIHADEPLTHANNMKLQCGGLHGLQHALDGSGEVADVAALVEAAQRKFDSLAQFPYSQIVQSVSAFQLRKPSGEE